jgi:hypothetical protein
MDIPKNPRSKKKAHPPTEANPKSSTQSHTATRSCAQQDQILAQISLTPEHTTVIPGFAWRQAPGPDLPSPGKTQKQRDERSPGETAEAGSFSHQERGRIRPGGRVCRRPRGAAMRRQGSEAAAEARARGRRESASLDRRHLGFGMGDLGFGFGLVRKRQEEHPKKPNHTRDETGGGKLL